MYTIIVSNVASCFRCSEFMGRLRATHPHVVVFTEVDIAGGKARSAPPGSLTAAWQAAGIRVAPPSPKGLRTRVLIQVGKVGPTPGWLANQSIIQFRLPQQQQSMCGCAGQA